MRAGEVRIWRDCRFWADAIGGPIYLLTSEPEVSFSFDGHSRVALTGTMGDREAGSTRAMARLRSGARLVPDDFEVSTMM